jgi:hypothetical protein
LHDGDYTSHGCKRNEGDAGGGADCLNREYCGPRFFSTATEPSARKLDT